MANRGLFPQHHQQQYSNFAGGGVKDELYGELSKACAGHLVDVPKVGERVYYFPSRSYGTIGGFDQSRTESEDTNVQFALKFWRMVPRRTSCSCDMIGLVCSVCVCVCVCRSLGRGDQCYLQLNGFKDLAKSSAADSLDGHQVSDEEGRCRSSPNACEQGNNQR